MGDGRILVVDDDPQVQAYLSDVLAHGGYSVTIARDGAVALRLLGTTVTRPDLVLLDLDLPKVSGLTVLASLRARPETRHIPTLVLTGSQDETHAVTCLDRGATDFLAKPVDSAELLARVRCHLHRAREAASWRDDACTDPLTGLMNRRSFRGLLAREVHQAARYRRSLVVVFIDVDEFKRINDERGHHVGDEILSCVADSIRRCLRRGDAAGRWGGDEFVIALPGSAASSAEDVVDRIRADVERTCGHIIGEEVGLSCGFSHLFEDARSDDEHAASKLINAADRSMYRNKAQRSSRHDILCRQDEHAGRQVV